MTPADFTRLLADINDRMRSLHTAGVSLLVLAGLAVAGGYGAHRIATATAESIAATGVISGLLLVGSGQMLAWRRNEVYEDIIVSGFRHVQPQAVARRAAKLASRTKRLRLADSLDQFVELVRRDQHTAVPVQRGALLECSPQVQLITTILRSDTTEIEPSGMVLLHRLVTDGARSPLFSPAATRRDLERELERITTELARAPLAAVV